MDEATLTALLSAEGRTALSAAAEQQPSNHTFLTDYDRLSKHFPPSLAKAALQMQLLRQKAREKFSRASEMLYTSDGLEQSSGETIATYRANRFTPCRCVGDFACGIGGDSIALATQTAVISVDLDAIRLRMAQHNLQVYDSAQRVRFLDADLKNLDLPDVDAIFFDPSRRSNNRRHVSGRFYEPPLQIIEQWQPKVDGLGVKLAPAIPHAELDKFEAEAEFISVNGELKECVLWFRQFSTTHRRATILPGPHFLTGDSQTSSSRLSEPLAYLYDPDPSVLRAGLVTTLGEQLDAHQLDETIAYLTSDTATLTPFARLYQIEAALPFHAQRLRELLRARNVGRVTIQRRGSPVDPAELTRKLRLSGNEHRHLILTRVSGKPFALVVERASAD